MIEYKKGDLFAEDAEALVNPVNCSGVMGGGIALAFRTLFPESYEAYVLACQIGSMRPGQMHVFETGRATNPRYIINFPTMRDVRDASRMEDIESGLAALALEIRKHEIRSIAIPALGCGIGGLSWSQVRPAVGTALGEIENLHVVLFEPGGIA